MKKFVVFVLILVVTVSLGITTFYFVRDNEELVVNTENFVYLNMGDSLEIDAEIKHSKIGNEIVFNLLTEGVLEWNPALNLFTAENGGATVIQVKTKNNKIAPVYIEVHVGNGMKEAPFYIDSEEDLLKIGVESDDNLFTKSDNYILMQDITLSGPINPILNGSEFTGSFNGNGHVISSLSINSNEEVKNAGLFSKLGSTGVITDLTLSDVNINGNFETAGSFAGINLGTITRSQVLTGLVSSSLDESSVGGICGINRFSGLDTNYGRVDRCASKISVIGTKNVGGLVGINEGAIVINSYSKLNGENSIKATKENCNVGGLIGLNSNLVDKVSTVKNCYAVSSVVLEEGLNEENCKVATLIGYNDEISKYASNYIMGVYTDSKLTSINNEFELTFNPEDNAKETNFRGIYNKFPVDENNKIIKEEMKSFIAKQTEGSTNVVYWDFDNVWLLDKNNENDGYPVLNRNGANVPDDISIINDPSQITNEQEFIEFTTKVNNGTAENYYILTKDLDFEGSTALNIVGTSTYPFKATFNGDGHTIKNVKISTSTINNLTGYKYAGLFGKTSTIASIKNLTLENVTIEEGATHAGSLVGYNEGTIENCKITQTTSNEEVNNVVATYAVGGIAGANFGLINNCKVVNQTIASISKYGNTSYTGGIAGLNGQDNFASRAIIQNSSVVTSFIMDIKNMKSYPSGYKFDYPSEFSNKANYVGGIAGSNSYLIESNYVYNSHIKLNKFNVKGTGAGIVAKSKSLELINQKLPEIKYNRTLKGTVTGHLSCGLVSNLYGIAQYNSIEFDNINGLASVGLAGKMSLSGGAVGARLNNCYVKAYLSLTDKKNGGAAGMVGILDMKDLKSAKGYTEFGQLLSACSFDSGLKFAFYDSFANYRNETKYIYNNRKYGIGNNIIWESTGGATYDKNDLAYYDTSKNNIKGYSKEEITLMTNIDNVKKTFTKFGFNASVWTLEEGIGNYPTLNNLPDIIEVEE